MVTSDIPIKADTQVTSKTNSDKNLTPDDAFSEPSSKSRQTNVRLSVTVLHSEHIVG